MHKHLERDCSLLLGGYLQGRFAKAGAGVGGIDLSVGSDEKGFHGVYKGREFSGYFEKNEKGNLVFYFHLNERYISFLKSEDIPHRKSQLTKLLEMPVYSSSLSNINNLVISCKILRPVENIRSPNDIFNDLWDNILKDVFFYLNRKN